MAWKHAMDLVEQVYVEVKRWPADERYGLTDQIRRAVVSVPSNIAEGQGRVGTKSFHQHLTIAYGSLCEVETHLVIAFRVGYIDQSTYDRLLVLSTEVARTLRGLMKSVQ